MPLIPAPKVPSYLFHWTTARTLDAMAAQASAQFPITKAVPSACILHRAYPQLRKKAVLFAWWHPIGGMSWGLGQPTVSYGGRIPEESRLIVFKMKPCLRALGLATPNPHAGLARIETNLDRIDALYHEIHYQKGSLVREWLILKASAIQEFTANPTTTRSFFRNEHRRLQDPAYDYPEAASHGRSSELRRNGWPYFLSITAAHVFRKTIVLPRLQAMSELSAREIPKPLRRPLRIEPAYLRRYSGEIYRK